MPTDRKALAARLRQEAEHDRLPLWARAEFLSAAAMLERDCNGCKHQMVANKASDGPWCEWLPIDYLNCDDVGHVCGRWEGRT